MAAWVRVNHAASLPDGRVALVARRGGGHAELLLAAGPGSVAERVPCVPALPEAAAVACRVRAAGERLLVASPCSLGVVTLPPPQGRQSTLSTPPARCARATADARAPPSRVRARSADDPALTSPCVVAPRRPSPALIPPVRRYTSLGVPLFAPPAGGGAGARLLDAVWHPLSARHVLALCADAVRLFDTDAANGGAPSSSTTSVHDAVATWLLPPVAPAGSCNQLPGHLPAPPVALAMGSARGWELLTAFIVCEDGAVFMLCPCLPPGCLLPAADWAELAMEADAAASHAAAAVSAAGVAAGGGRAPFAAPAAATMQQQLHSTQRFSRLGGGGSGSTPAPGFDTPAGGAPGAGAHSHSSCSSAPASAYADAASSRSVGSFSGSAPSAAVLAGRLDAASVRLQWLHECFTPVTVGGDAGWRRFTPVGAFGGPPHAVVTRGSSATPDSQRQWAPALQGPLVATPSLAPALRSDEDDDEGGVVGGGGHEGRSGSQRQQRRLAPAPVVDLQLLPASLTPLTCCVLLVADGRLVSLVSPGPVAPCWSRPAATYAGVELVLAPPGAQLAGLATAVSNGDGGSSSAAPWLLVEALQLPLHEEDSEAMGERGAAGDPSGRSTRRLHPLASARRALTHSGAAAFAGGAPGEGLAGASQGGFGYAGGGSHPAASARLLLPAGCDVVSVPQLVPPAPGFPQWLLVASRFSAYAVNLGWLTGRAVRALTEPASAVGPIARLRPLHSEGAAHEEGSDEAEGTHGGATSGGGGGGGSSVFRVWGAGDELARAESGASAGTLGLPPSPARRELLGLALVEGGGSISSSSSSSNSRAERARSFPLGSVVAWGVALGAESAALPPPHTGEGAALSSSVSAASAARGVFSSPSKALAPAAAASSSSSSSSAATAAVALLAAAGPATLSGSLAAVPLPLVAAAAGTRAGAHDHCAGAAVPLRREGRGGNSLGGGASSSSAFAATAAGVGAGDVGGLRMLLAAPTFASTLAKYSPVLALAQAGDALTVRAQAALDAATGGGGVAGGSEPAVSVGSLPAGAPQLVTLSALAAGGACGQAVAASLASLRVQTAARAALLSDAAVAGDELAWRLSRALAELAAAGAAARDRLTLLAAGVDNLRDRCRALVVAAALQQGGGGGGGGGGGDGGATPTAAEAAAAREMAALRSELHGRLPGALARVADAVDRLAGGTEGGGSGGVVVPPLGWQRREPPGGGGSSRRRGGGAQLAALHASLDVAGGVLGGQAGLVGALSAALAEAEAAMA